MKKSSIIPFFILFICLISTSELSAQSFLKKMGKTVDKLLETPEKTENKETNTSNIPKSTKTEVQKKVYAYSELDKIPVLTPHITTNTKKIDLEPTVRSYTYTDVYDSVFWFSSTHGKSWVPYDRDGKRIMEGYTHPFSNVPYFHNGVTLLRHKDGACLVDKQGIIQKKVSIYNYSFFNNKGIAPALMKKNPNSSNSERLGVFVNTQGEIVFDSDNKVTGTFDVQDTRDFHDSLMAYYDYTNRLWGFLDTEFKVRVTPKYAEVHDFKEKLAAVKDAKGVWGFINTQGETVIPHKFTYEPSDFNEGYAIARKKGVDNPYVFINLKGEVVCDEMSSAKPFQDGYAIVMRSVPNYGNADCLIDKDFKIVHVFSNGQYAIKLGNNYYTKIGIWNKISGVETPFSEGLAKFNYEDPQTNKWLRGLLNEKAEIIILFEKSEF